MAKMFYTLEEAAAKLDKTPDEIRALASSGQLPEFRDRDRLMFKVEHVDLLAGGKEDDDIIPLADSGELEPISLASSGSASGIALDNPKEQTGISIFDADATEEADPSAQTQVTAPAGKVEDPGRSGSGSGLLDMTRDVDDTSLGANLLDDVYGENAAQQTTEEPAQSEGTGESAALFETSGTTEGAEAAGAAPAMIMATQEVYDGAGSGFAGGLAIGAVASLLVAAFAIVLGMTGTGGSLLNTLGDNLWAFVGGLAGLTLLGAIVGWLIGKRS